MRKYFLIIALLTTCFVNAQHKQNKKDTSFVNVDIDKLKRQIDSSSKQIESLSNNTMKQIKDDEMKRFEEQNNRSLDAFMREQNEQREKEKKAMWIRFGFGIILLGVFIFGIIRRRKKSTQ